MPAIKLEPAQLLRWGLWFLLLFKYFPLMALHTGSFSAPITLIFLGLTPFYLCGKKSWAAVLLGILVFTVNAGYFQLTEFAVRSHHMIVLAAAFWCLSFQFDKKRFYASLSLLIFSVYLLAGLRKLNPEFLSGMRLEQILREYSLGSEMILPFRLEVGIQLASVLAVLTELCLAFYPWMKGRPQRMAFFVGVFFHALLALVIPVSIFSVLMTLLLFVLLSVPPADRQFVSIRSSD